MSSIARDEKSGWRRAGSLRAPGIADVRLWLADWLQGRELLGVERLPGGLMNRNCRLRVAGSPDVVLRLYDRNPSAAAKERTILELLTGELPVPKVLYANDQAARPFLILEWIDGRSLFDIKRADDRDAMAALAHEAGLLLARLQTHRFDRCGLLTQTLAVHATGLPDPPSTAALVEFFARSAAFRSRVGAGVAQRLLAAVRDWDDRPRAPLLPATLVHGDFNTRNLLVRRDVGRWSVAAILDWEFAFAGPLYCDIGSFLRYERADYPRFEPAFSRGLRDGGVPLEGDWLGAARMADLPALCELLARDSTPEDVAAEVAELISRAMT